MMRIYCEEVDDWVSREYCDECVDPCSSMLEEPPRRGYCGFADPGGRSALRAAGPDNPRNLPCPTCGEPDRLTPRDRALGYQCNHCADMAERGW